MRVLTSCVRVPDGGAEVWDGGVGVQDSGAAEIYDVVVWRWGRNWALFGILMARVW